EVLLVADVQIRPPVAVEVGNEKRVVAFHRSPSGQRVVEASNELQVGASGAQHQQIAHGEVAAVEDDDILLAGAVEVGDEKLVARPPPAPARQVAIEAPHASKP